MTHPPGRRDGHALPTYLFARLAMAGKAGPLTKKPKRATCAKCGTALIVALETSGDAAGPRLALDGAPVSVNGELWAAAYSIPAFDHWGDCITARIPNWTQFVKTNSLAVLVAHVCGLHWEVDPAAMKRLYRPGVAATSRDEPPPF